MSITTLLILAFVVYSIFNSLGGKKKDSPGKPGPKAGQEQPNTPFPWPYESGQNSQPPTARQEKRKPTSFWEMLEEWTEGGIKPPPLSGKGSARPIPAYGSLGGESGEGTQGMEGRESSEGLWGTEGRGGDEGRWGVEGRTRDQRLSQSKAKGQLPQTGDLNPVNYMSNPVPVSGTTPAPGLQIGRQAAMQGIIWAEVLGRPRALRPFRGPRG